MSFAIVGINVMAFSVLITWIFIHARSSVLITILMHLLFNVTVNSYHLMAAAQRVLSEFASRVVGFERQPEFVEEARRLHPDIEVHRINSLDTLPVVSALIRLGCLIKMVGYFRLIKWPAHV